MCSMVTCDKHMKECKDRKAKKNCLKLDPPHHCQIRGGVIGREYNTCVQSCKVDGDCGNLAGKWFCTDYNTKHPYCRPETKQ